MKRVAIIAENSNEYIKTLLKIWDDGDCAVLIDWRIPVNSIMEMLQLAKVEVCYTDLINLWDLLQSNENVFCCLLKKMSNSVFVENEIYDNFQSRYNDEEALILFSSGTTGNAKGVVLSHAAINKNADAILDYLNLDKDVFFLSKSLSHSSTIVGELLVGLKSRTPIFLSVSYLSPNVLLKNLALSMATIAFLNPTLLKLLSNINKTLKVEFPKLKKIYVSGSILNLTMAQKAKISFPKTTIYNVYGLTECGPRVSAQTELQEELSGSVGKPVKNVKVKIVSPQGKEIGINKPGIVSVYTPSLFKYYLGRESSVNKDEWFNTSDIGLIDENNNLYILGRYDNTIISSSHNVCPEEVERIINEIDGVNDCIVIGIKDELYGEKMICLYEGEEKDKLMLVSKCKEFLAPYEIPKDFICIDKLFRTNNGKLIRSADKYKNIFQS